MRRTGFELIQPLRIRHFLGLTWVIPRIRSTTDNSVWLVAVLAAGTVTGLVAAAAGNANAMANIIADNCSILIILISLILYLAD
jgi:4-alpha-glucanotransferase